MAWDVMSWVTKMAWDVMSGVTKTAWDVLSGVVNLCGMFCPGCKKMAWDVLSRDVLSGSRFHVIVQIDNKIKLANQTNHITSLRISKRVCRVYIHYSNQIGHYTICMPLLEDIGQLSHPSSRHH